MPLSLEILSLIVNNLRNDQGTLSSCSLAFRTLSTIASAHLLRRRVFLVDVDKSPVSMLIQQLEGSVRLRMVEELHLVRKEPDEEVGEWIIGNIGENVIDLVDIYLQRLHGSQWVMPPATQPRWKEGNTTKWHRRMQLPHSLSYNIASLSSSFRSRLRPLKERTRYPWDWSAHGLAVIRS